MPSRSPIVTSVADPLLKVSEIALELRAGEKTVYRRLESGKLPAFKEGGRWLIRRSVLLAYIRSHEPGVASDGTATWPSTSKN